MNNGKTGGVRCHNADACAFGQKPCPTPECCGCVVQGDEYKPAEAVHQIAEPDALDIRELAAKLAFELECMLIDPHEHWDSAARALDAYKQAQGPSPSPFATDVPIPPERKAIYAALRAKREAAQAKHGGAA